MKILVVSNMYPDDKHPSYGVFVKNFCEQLGILGIEHSKAVMYKSDSKMGKIVNYITFYLNAFFSCLFGKHDLVYVHYASNSSVPVLWAQKFRKNTIYTNVHGSDVVPENAQHEKMQRYTERILSLSRKVIVPSEFFKRLVVDKYGLIKDEVYVVCSGGVNKEVFYSEQSAENIDEKKIRLGYVGRITPKKGWRTFLDACEYLRDIPKELIIVGNGSEDELLEKQIDEMQLRDCTTRYNLVSQEELRKIYNQLELFVFPTEGESLGLVGIEAMACGVPVIVSDETAPADYVFEGVNGYTFKMKDSIDLAYKIKKFYDLSSEQKSMLKDNAIKTAEIYSKEHVLEQMKVVFEE